MATSFFVTEATERVGARCGVMMGKALTPLALLDTAGGQPVEMMPEVAKSLPGALVPAVRFAEISKLAPDVVKRGQTLSSFCNMDDCPTFLTQRDPKSFAPVLSTAKGFPFPMAAGRMPVTPQAYCETAAKLKPDVLVSLADEVPTSSGKNRQRKSTEVTEKWLQTCVEHRPPETPLLASIVGGLDPMLRARSAASAVAQDVEGFLFCGFGTGESPEETVDHVRKLCDAVPSDKLRVIVGPGEPTTVLELISAGVDVFDTDYPSTVTRYSCALTLVVNPPWEASAEVEASESKMEGDEAPRSDNRIRSKISLIDRRFERDQRPITAGCECYTCKNHSRGYIQHLIAVHEMLAPTLLQIHNVHVYSQFLAAVRRAISVGKFEAFKTWFLEANGLRPLAVAAAAAAPEPAPTLDAAATEAVA